MNDLISRLEAAGHDERLADGPLYLEAAEALRVIKDSDEIEDALSGLELDMEYHRLCGFPQTVERLQKAISIISSFNDLRIALTKHGR
jgi:hypothetical protein